MPLVQKWLLGILALGAAVAVLASPDAAYKLAKGAQGLTAGSVTEITTGGKAGALQ